MLAGIETSRLVLRPWQKSDHAPFIAMNQDPAVMEFFPSLWTARESTACIERFSQAWQMHGWGMFAAELKQTKAFIGFVGLNIPAYPLPFPSAVEIGWRLARPYWGQGLATEAARASLEFGFSQVKLPQIISFTPVLNVRSEAVMKKIGMSNSGHNFLHPLIPQGHILQQHLLYRLSHQAWQETRRSDS